MKRIVCSYFRDVSSKVKLVIKKKKREKITRASFFALVLNTESQDYLLVRERLSHFIMQLDMCEVAARLPCQ